MYSRRKTNPPTTSPHSQFATRNLAKRFIFASLYPPRSFMKFFLLCQKINSLPSTRFSSNAFFTNDVDWVLEGGGCGWDCVICVSPVLGTLI